jgi:hypothetical protein
LSNGVAPADALTEMVRGWSRTTESLTKSEAAAMVAPGDGFRDANAAHRLTAGISPIPDKATSRRKRG